MFRYPHLYIKFYFNQFNDYLLYKVLKANKRKAVLPQNIRVKIEYDKSTKTFFACSMDMDGIYTASEDIEKLIKNINQQIYEYSYVPRERYKELGVQYRPSQELIEMLLKNGAPITFKMGKDSNLAYN